MSSWEDTVMSDEQLSHGLSPLVRKQMVAIRCIAKAQAELSFKAGIREAVEWIQNHGGCLDGWRQEWQSKLKEWGLEQKR